jgi:hypothetical protein
MTEPWGAVRGAPELVPPLHIRHSVRAIPTRIPLLALRRMTGYVGSQQTKPGVLQAVPVTGRCGDTAIFRPMDMGVLDGEA